MCVLKDSMYFGCTRVCEIETRTVSINIMRGTLLRTEMLVVHRGRQNENYRRGTNTWSAPEEAFGYLS